MLNGVDFGVAEDEMFGVEAVEEFVEELGEQGGQRIGVEVDRAMLARQDGFAVADDAEHPGGGVGKEFLECGSVREDADVGGVFDDFERQHGQRPVPGLPHE
jgi:hypothetical protein